MTQSPPGGFRPRPFRAFVNRVYWENRDEYDAYGQTQPWTVEQFYLAHKRELRKRFREECHLVVDTHPS